VDRARKLPECSRNENDPLYPLWMLILVPGLRKGEWQLQRVGWHPLSRKQVRKADNELQRRRLRALLTTALPVIITLLWRR
jgi:hypothetical protein